MRDFYTFEDASLVVGARSAAKVKVSLEIATPDDDEWAEEEDTEEYHNGMRVCGELQIDVYFNNTFIKKMTEGILEVTNDGERSKFPIVILDMLDSVSIVHNKHKRHFWLFVCLQKPIRDDLELFPEHLRREKLRVYTVTNFNGRWPLGVSCVVVAKDRKEARRLLDLELDKASILKGEKKDYDLDELDVTQPQALVFKNSY